MIQVGNFRFEDAELNSLPKPDDSVKIGEINSFTTNAIGENGGTIPVLVTYRGVLQTSVETEENINTRLSAIDAEIARLTEEKTRMNSDKGKLNSDKVS